MDNTQICAPDGSWFLFADWQGLTRITLPGDRVKTDANLDRPHERRPLVLRPDGKVWSGYAVDVDPIALKKVAQLVNGHDSPDPLGGPEEIVVGHAGDTVSIRGRALALAASGEPLQLGGVPGRIEAYGHMRYNVWPDGAVVVFGSVAPNMPRTQAALVLRDAEGAARVAWCRPTALAPNGSPDAFRADGRAWLTDRDITTGVAHLVEIGDDGVVLSTAHTPAVAGPWVFAGQVWWQPEDSTLCAGPSLGVVARSFTLPAAHAGAGRLLRLPRRVLFLPWHGASILDLAPTKKGKEELSRKHKAAEAPLYHEAERLLRPIREGMARRGIRVEWRGLTRRGKSLTPSVEISGRADLVTYILGYALQDAMAARLKPVGVTSVYFSGGGSYDDIFSQPAPTTAQDLRDLIAMLDAAGLERVPGFSYLRHLNNPAAQRGLPLPFTPEADALRNSAALGELPPATDDPTTPTTEQSSVSPPVATPDAEQARIAAVIEGVLVSDFGVDLEASREGEHWYRFRIGTTPLQAGINRGFRVQAMLCATETDLDMRELATSLAAANKSMVGARFEESDCYLHARAACALAEVSAAQVKAMIQACNDALESPQGQALRSKYRTYD